MEFSSTISVRESEVCFSSYCKAKDKFKMAARKDIGQCSSQENWPETGTSYESTCKCVEHETIT